MPTLCLAVHGAEYPVTLRDSPRHTRLGPPAAHDPYTGGTQWKRKYARLPEALPH